MNGIEARQTGGHLVGAVTHTRDATGRQAHIEEAHWLAASLEPCLIDQSNHASKSRSRCRGPSDCHEHTERTTASTTPQQQPLHYNSKHYTAALRVAAHITQPG